MGRYSQHDTLDHLVKLKKGDRKESVVVSGAISGITETETEMKQVHRRTFRIFFSGQTK